MEASRHARLFRALLRLYPRAFREAYGREMTELFLDRLARARAIGPSATARLWKRTLADVLSSAGAERMGRRTIGATAAGRGARGEGPSGDTITSERDGHMNGWALDVRHAARRLARSPLFTAAAIVILAVGLGANTAAFSVVDAALFRPPPFERPEEIVFVYQDSDDGEPSSSAYPAYLDMAARTDVFARVAATSPEVVTWDAATEPRQASVEFTTSSYLPVLGLSTSRGVWFSPEHDDVGAGLFAVVSHRTWRRELGGAEDILGSTVRLNGQPVTVIGVGPEAFNGAVGALVTDFWLSISSTPVGGDFRVENLQRREDHWYDVVARLAPGVPVEQARAAMDALALRMGETYPELDRGRGITVYEVGDVRFHPEVDGVLMTAGVALMAVVGLVLLLACSNLANLLLVRGVSRSQEMAVRQALGAGRGRVARLFLLEAVMLSGAGAVAGVLLARWLVGLLPGLPLPLPDGMALDVTIDGRVLAFGSLLAVATALFFGLLPASRATTSDVAGPLREEGRSASAGRRRTLVHGGLVAVQVAASLVLLIGAGLFARSLSNVRGVQPGFEAEALAVLGVNPSQGGVSSADAPGLMEAVLTRIRTLPGVSGAALTSRLPVQPGGSTTTVVEGYEPVAGTEAVELPFAYVSREWFETLGVPLVAGRGFGPDDRPESPRVVLVNQTAADRFWGGDAVGKRMRPQGSPDAWREVIGVVADVKVGSLQEPPTPMIYFSAEQTAVGCCFIVARAEGDPGALLPGLREALAEVAPRLSPTRLSTLESHLGQALTAPRAAAAVMGVFSLIALILATLGVYAVVAFAVARRAPELGIRIALGAARARIIGMVIGESLIPVGLGIVVGLGLAWLGAPRLGGVLFGIGALDPLAHLGAALLLLAVAAVAASLPAWSAVRGDPVEVLRTS